MAAKLFRYREIDPVHGCWLWTSGVRPSRNGDYGVVTNMKRQYAVHRLAAYLWLGFDLDDPRFVLHRCDVPRCFNPEHLFVGTHQDNMDDAVAKGRKRKKLTWDDVVEIRARVRAGEGQRSLARAFGLNSGTVCRIVAGKIWKVSGESANLTGTQSQPGSGEDLAPVPTLEPVRPKLNGAAALRRLSETEDAYPMAAD